MTLVEVLAGLVVLGTVLTMILMIRGRYTRQFSLAERRLEAIQAADELIGSWLDAGGEAVPVGATGVAGANLVWRTSLLVDEAAARLSAQVVRVEFLDSREIRAQRGPVPRPLAVIDLLVPGPRSHLLALEDPADSPEPADSPDSPDSPPPAEPAEPATTAPADAGDGAGESSTQPTQAPTTRPAELYLDPRLKEAPPT
jgi:hypothetical protein